MVEELSHAKQECPPSATWRGQANTSTGIKRVLPRAPAFAFSEWYGAKTRTTYLQRQQQVDGVGLLRVTRSEVGDEGGFLRVGNVVEYLAKTGTGALAAGDEARVNGGSCEPSVQGRHCVCV